MSISASSLCPSHIFSLSRYLEYFVICELKLPLWKCRLQNHFVTTNYKILNSYACHHILLSTESVGVILPNRRRTIEVG